MKDFELRLDSAFRLVAFATNRHIVDHFNRLTRDLGLDVESAIIWGTLAHLNLSHVIGPGANPNAMAVAQSDLELVPKPVRLSDLAQIVGLPRETVRRKLEALRRSGRVKRDEKGYWTLDASGVDEAVREFTKETIRRLLNTASHIKSILEEVDLPES